MLACSYRPLFRVTFQALDRANNFAIYNLPRYFQKCMFSHALRSELKMERKGKKVDLDDKKQKSVMQVWRAVSTQPSFCQGDNETTKPQSQLGETHNTISSNVSTSISENILDEPVDTDSCPRTENSNNDESSDGDLIPPEKHSLSMEIGSSLWRFIKGKEGHTLEEIEQETQVKIIFASSKKEDSITVEGNSAESVTKASEKLRSIIDKAVNSPQFDYSHFVSLPLAIHPELVDKLVSFQNKVLGVEASDRDEHLDNDSTGHISDGGEEDPHLLKASKVLTEQEAEKATPDVKEIINNENLSTKAPIVAVELKIEHSDAPVKVNMTNMTSIPLVSYAPKELAASVSESSSKLKDSRIEKSIFIKPKTFHLTVLMLKLWNNERVKKAAEVLQSVSSKVLDALENRPVSIRLKGLETMRGSLDKARVVYAPVEVIGGEGRLLHACQVIIDAFVEAGLVMAKDTQQKLKLHATIMNARHRKRKKGAKKADSFDARNIFMQYGSEEWGEYTIQEAHLSQRFVFDENGYYHCCVSIPFPDSMQAE